MFGTSGILGRSGFGQFELGKPLQLSFGNLVLFSFEADGESTASYALLGTLKPSFEADGISTASFADAAGAGHGAIPFSFEADGSSTAVFELVAGGSSGLPFSFESDGKCTAVFLGRIVFAATFEADGSCTVLFVSCGGFLNIACVSSGTTDEFPPDGSPAPTILYDAPYSY